MQEWDTPVHDRRRTQASTLRRVDSQNAPVISRHGAATSTNELLHDAASVLLPGGADHITLPDDFTGGALLGTAQANGVLGPLLFSLPDSADDLREQVTAAYEPVLLWCLELELRLLEIKGWFEDVGGIDFRVLKGPAVAHLDELDPSLRSFADIDLLIPAGDIDRALAVLQRHGAERRIPEHHRGFDRRFSKGVGLTCGDGIEIDLHRTLCVGALGQRIPLDELFKSPEQFDIGGQQFAALSLPHRALHAAYHAVIGSPTPALKTLRDLAGYLTRPTLTPELLVPEARRWGGATVLAEAVRAAFANLTFDAPIWRIWADDFSPDSDDEELIRHSQYESAAPYDLAFIRELPWRDRAAYVWGTAWPSKQTLDSRGVTHWSRIRHGIANLRRSQ